LLSQDLNKPILILPVILKNTKIMSDDKNKTDGRDRSRVEGDESYELSYLEEKLGVNREQVKEAIEKVGDKPKDVEAYLTHKGK
jgi:hypothetical protein